VKTLKKILAALACSVWLFGIIHFSLQMMAFDSTPGARAEAPPLWPAQSTISHVAGRKVLVMFIHPECSCSHASLEQLALLENLLGGQLTARVVLWHSGSSAASGRWRQRADAVPVVDDRDGREARIFGAKTSGQTMIYNEYGRLIYAGGLTVLRGEAGGERALQDIARVIKESRNSGVERPVFGCPIYKQPQAEHFGGAVSAWTKTWTKLQ
jgi:hypothetical protein